MIGSVYVLGCVDGGYADPLIVAEIWTSSASGIPWIISISDAENTQPLIETSPTGENLSKLGDGPAITSAACVGLADGLHVLVTVAGNLWHAVQANGSLQWDHVHGPVNSGIGSFDDVDCAADGETLHVVGLVAGNVWHSARIGGAWSSFTHLHGPNNDGHGPVTQVACTVVNGQLNVFAFCAPNLWRSIEQPSGTWPDFNAFYAHDGPAPSSLSCSGLANGEIHLVALLFGDGTGGPGYVWHGMFNSEGAWSPFTAIGDAAGLHGVNAAACASDGTNLFVGAARDGQLTGNVDEYSVTTAIFVTRRDSAGNWQGIGPNGDTPPFNSFITKVSNLSNSTWMTYGGLLGMGYTRPTSSELGQEVEGMLVQEAGLPEIFRVAGGAPIYVSNWANIGGPQPVETLSSDEFQWLGMLPRDGTLIQAHDSGEVFVVAGGAPIYISNWANIGGVKPSVLVDGVAISDAGQAAPFNHLNATPTNGTFIQGQQTQRVYRIQSGAAIYVADWSAVGGPQPYVVVDQVAIDNAGQPGVWSHLRLLNRVGVVNGAGQLSVKEGALDAAWDAVSTGVTTFALAGDRIGVVNAARQLSVKEGALNAPWTLISDDVSAFALAGDRIGVVNAARQLSVKEGALNAPWTLISDDVSAFALAEDRIGVVNAAGQLSVKDGALDAAWDVVSTGVTAFRLAGDRIGVVNAAGQLSVKDGALDAAWDVVSTGVTAFALAGDRIGVVNAAGQLSVKDGALNAAWDVVSTGVTAFALAGDRIGVVNAAGQLSVKDGALDAAWDVVSTGASQLALGGQDP